jgi:hypothetical protein
VQTDSVRARLAKLEEEIAAFERWQRDSYPTDEWAREKARRPNGPIQESALRLWGPRNAPGYPHRSRAEAK